MTSSPDVPRSVSFPLVPRTPPMMLARVPIDAVTGASREIGGRQRNRRDQEGLENKFHVGSRGWTEASAVPAREGIGRKSDARCAASYPRRLQSRGGFFISDARSANGVCVAPGVSESFPA